MATVFSLKRLQATPRIRACSYVLELEEPSLFAVASVTHGQIKKSQSIHYSVETDRCKNPRDPKSDSRYESHPAPSPESYLGDEGRGGRGRSSYIPIPAGCEREALSLLSASPDRELSRGQPKKISSSIVLVLAFVIAPSAPYQAFVRGWMHDNPGNPEMVALPHFLKRRFDSESSKLRGHLIH